MADDPSNDLALLDATAQAELVRRGDASPRELVDAAIARIERVNPRLNAVIAERFAKARDEAASPALADGPFRGVPILAKDLTMHTAGDPFHCGMAFLRKLGWAEQEDTFLAARFKAAGFVFVGKSNTPELGPVPTTEPLAYGPTRNPWDTTRSPGGSSGGSAAAVASGMVPIAHANDGGGSIRIPASACGLVGLKPSRGRTSLGPGLGESWAGLTIEHVVTRSVRDAAAALDVVAGCLPGDPYAAPTPRRPWREEVGADPGRLRIGLMTTAPGNAVAVHPDCLAAAEAAAKLIASLGHIVEPAHPEALHDPETMRAGVTVVTSWTARDLDYWSERTGKTIGPDDVEPMIWALAEMGRGVSAVNYVRATEQLQRSTRRLAGWWASGFDLLLTPTLPEPPPTLGQFAATADDPLRGFARGADFVMFTMPWNVSGQPAISLPLHWSPSGLPIGVQLVAAYGGEDVLLRIAAQLEAARPWRDRRPPVHAAA